MIPAMNSNPYMANMSMQNPYMQYQPTQTNPYMDNRLANLQQFQQSLQPQQPSYLNGKVVDSIDVVKATDIPMDGNSYFFPKADGTEIYSKSWLPDGKTRILTYKPFSEPQTDISMPEPAKFDFGAMETILDTLLKRFDGLENKFEKLEKSITPKQTTTRVKKESEE